MKLIRSGVKHPIFRTLLTGLLLAPLAAPEKHRPEHGCSLNKLRRLAGHPELRESHRFI